MRMRHDVGYVGSDGGDIQVVCSEKKGHGCVYRHKGDITKEQ